LTLFKAEDMSLVSTVQLSNLQHLGISTVSHTLLGITSSDSDLLLDLPRSRTDLIITLLTLASPNQVSVAFSEKFFLKEPFSLANIKESKDKEEDASEEEDNQKQEDTKDNTKEDSS
jgi:hypothetical protein